MIAQVIVDISNSEVDRIFDYTFEHCDVFKGSRVLVPFGSRSIEGYVINLKETSDYDLTKLKAIIKPLDTYPVIGEEMLDLMLYMCNKYHLRVVDALRLFIPSQMRGGKVKELNRLRATIAPQYLVEDKSKFIKPSAAAQNELFDYLSSEGDAEVTYLNQNYSAAALRNLVARGIVLQTSFTVNRKPYKNLENQIDSAVTLTDEQRTVVDSIDGHNTFLLHGITGSGKTEVYMHCILKMLKLGKTAIVLEPEISLTPQVLRNFRARFGDEVAILHSGLSAGERFDEWRRLINGEARVAVGARSAIFAPLKNVGLIIIDEEHDSSYASESNPRYVTSDIAQFRANYNKCSLVMGSATPSIESYNKAMRGTYKLLELKNRINKRDLPEIKIVNMCDELYNGNNSIFSARLLSELTDCIKSGNQAIIFINRRGYSSYMMCRSCGYVAKCEQCDVSLVFHRDENVLKCHYCNNRYAALDICPQCKSPHIKQGYVGTQKVVDELSKIFPNKKILRMDNDTTQNKDAHLKILNEFAEGRASILVGTQMIAKGHDFADVTFVGIVDADMSLHFSDFRSAERTYQLITQVSGRAGRDLKAGKVVLQTYTPNHYVYRLAVSGNYKAFFDKECNLREVTKYPPFSQIVRLLVSSEYEEVATTALKSIFEGVTELSKQNTAAFAYLSAMRSPVKRIQNKHRMQIIARIVDNFDELIQKIYDIVDKSKNPKVSIFTEINPGNLS